MGVKLEEAKSIKISEKQAAYILSIIDNNIDLHRRLYGHLCVQPEKRVDSEGNTICNGECDDCTNLYYAKRRTEMMKKAGLCNNGKNNTLHI